MAENYLPGVPGETKQVLRCRDLCLGYHAGNSWKRVVDAVSFGIKEKETLAIVGESGSGKSTIAKALVKLIPVEKGSILINGTETAHLNARGFLPWRKWIQLVFQDPWSALNPRLTVDQLLMEPLELHFPDLDRKAKNRRIRELVDAVRLPAGSEARYPSEFSGGQRQRILIARSLAVHPQILVCDEPVSALDVSIQAELLDLLRELKESQGLTLLFISHDLAVVQQIADHVLVLKQGRSVEFADVYSLFRNPRHPYTQTLLEACPKW